MGGGSYSSVDRTIRYKTEAENAGYESVDAYLNKRENVFNQHNLNNAMNPFGLDIRESRDSEEHPESLAIIIALDVTGSMGSIPHHLVKEDLPKIVETLIQAGIQHPQILFLGIGDHTCDDAPVQVGQFESSDELMDKWLTSVYLEGGGGSNYGESYLLAWYVAANHTDIDCFNKRNQKGFLFTIGDEPNLSNISSDSLKRLFGPGQYQNETKENLLEKANEKYRTYHIHTKQTMSGQRQEVIDGWKQDMSDHLFIANSHSDIATIIANIIVKQLKPNQQLTNAEGEKLNNEEPIL